MTRSFKSALFGLSLLSATNMLTCRADALVINYTTLSGDTLTSAQSAAFAKAAQAWESVITSAVTVNVSIGFTSSLAANVLGSTNPYTGTVSYAAAVQSLKNGNSMADKSGVAALPSSIGGAQVVVTQAQAEVMGFSSPTTTATSGTIQFNSSFNFATSRNSDGTISSNSYDLVGIAEHEIGHLLGFDSNLDLGITSNVNGSNVADRSVLDLFRYSSPGNLSYGIGSSAYFSVDGGKTDLATFSTGSGDQASHWSNGFEVNGVNAVMDPESSMGQVINVTSLDAEALDVAGWAVSPTVYATALPASGNEMNVPEPNSLALMVPMSLLGLGLASRRRSTPFMATA